MNGADLLCETLLANGIDTCFANPGTSEMHFVSALDRQPRMHCVLGLFEGVVTAAADGYARMAGRPAATLLHCGPGLANGLANLHNARRARSPMVNIVGDHAGYHLDLDAPLTTDIAALARPMSHWVGRAESPDAVGVRVAEALTAALATPGVATMMLPADSAWGAVSDPRIPSVPRPALPLPLDDLLDGSALALEGGRNVAIILGGPATYGASLDVAGRIAAKTGATLFSERAARSERGAGRVAPIPVPYNVDLAVEAFAGFDCVILVGGRAPVAFFAYPGKPGNLLPPGCEVIPLADEGQDIPATISLLEDRLGARDTVAPVHGRQVPERPAPAGALTPDAISLVVARLLPDDAIIVEESLTSAGRLAQLAPTIAPHDHLPLTGGSIGIGIPMSAGAAVACPARKVLCLQADGSGMYTLQGLWTQARENLDVVTIVFSNRGYRILRNEMRNVGVTELGRNAQSMLDIDRPALDWVSLAAGMGVEAIRVETVLALEDALTEGFRRKGPLLIEAALE